MDDGARIGKVLNNNVVIAVDDRGGERVVMGRGIGFQRRRGDAVDPALVEKVFVLDTGTDVAHVQAVLAEAPFEVVDAVTSAVTQAAADLGHDLGRHLPFALIDHVQFVLRRLSDGIRIPAAPAPELVVLYPDEHRAAQRMVDEIGRRVGTPLPDEEAVFLTMHLLGATRDEQHGNAALLLRRVQHVVTLVEEATGRPVDPASLDGARFLVHVKFLLQRLADAKMLQGGDSSFYAFARHSYPRSDVVATRVSEYVEAATGIRLTDEERLYLIVHVERLWAATGG